MEGKINEKEWEGFHRGGWCQHINVRDFIKENYTPYTGRGYFFNRTNRKNNQIMEKSGRFNGI